MLDYVTLFIPLFAAITIFYGIIAINDIPYEIAKKRNHPPQGALHVAGWAGRIAAGVSPPASRHKNLQCLIGWQIGFPNVN